MSRAEELKVWYLSLQQREQRILAVGVVFVIVTVVYLGLLNPYFNSRKHLQAAVVEKQSQVAWMGPAATQLQALRGQQPSGIPAGQSLLAVVSRAAGDAGFGAAVKQAQTDSDGSVRVQLQAVAFDNLIRWLGTLRRQYGISVKQMTAQKAATAGNVDATLTLSTGS
ncbi:MAG TPA: type II secretion system protein GspM [Gammaproteobacteria bacterium]|jgi:general secretion pathway protein M